jgi:phospholipase/carboxylesterase
LLEPRTLADEEATTMQHERWSGGDREMAYRIELPAGDPPPAGFPFLLGLHGYSEHAGVMAARLAVDGTPPYARVFPSGPTVVEVGEGDARRTGHSWYVYTGDQAAFRRELEAGEAMLTAFVRDVAARHGLDPTRGVLAGYSQGGYLGSFVALRNREVFRGLVAIACRVKHEALTDVLPAAAGYPVLGLHGERDRATKPAPQAESFAALRSHGLDAELVLHPGGHRLPPTEAPRVDAFVRQVLGPAAGE